MKYANLISFFSLLSKRAIPSKQANKNTGFVSSRSFSRPVILKYKLLINKDVHICNRRRYFI